MGTSIFVTNFVFLLIMSLFNRGRGTGGETVAEMINREHNEQMNIDMINGLKRCFFVCVNDFATSTLTSKEDQCLARCHEKSLAVNERMTRSFNELQLLESERNRMNKD